MYDPLSLSQTGARASTGARSLLQAANQTVKEEKIKAETKPDGVTETEKTEKKTKIEAVSGDQPDNKPKATPDSLAAKREWCRSNMTPNFFATPTANKAKEPSVEALDQFQNFVNVICPALDLNIPSKCANCTAF